MEWTKDKYFKKAVKTLGFASLTEKAKSLDELNKNIDKYIQYKETLIENLDIAKNNLKICPTNISNLRDAIERMKEQMLLPEIKYHSIKRERAKDLIEEWKEWLYDNEESLISARENIIEIPLLIQNVDDILTKYLYLIEPQMKIERMKDLNKGKNYSYSVV